MRELSLLMKPAAADCNLRCAYCFYLDRQRWTPPHPRMSHEILERTIATFMSSRQPASYTFSWQGGEPGLLGLRFFAKAVELQKKYAPPGAIVCNGFQTNGTLLTDELAAFFAEYRFLVGISLDGPAQAHDPYRQTLAGQPTHASVLKGIDRLRRRSVDFNILALVNDRTVRRAREIYGYLKNHGFVHQQYVPCVEFDEAGRLRPYSVTGAAWGAFLCEIFDRWISEDTHRISIRLFDSILEYLLTGKRNACTMGTDCRQYFVVEYDGSIYPCDFFVRDEWRLGNIGRESWKDLLASDAYRRFGLRKADWADECRSCPWLPLCHGDCPKFRAPPAGRSATSVLCEGWRAFYTHALPRLERLAEEIKAQEPPREPASRRPT